MAIKDHRSVLNFTQVLAGLICAGWLWNRGGIAAGLLLMVLMGWVEKLIESQEDK